MLHHICRTLRKPVILVHCDILIYARRALSRCNITKPEFADLLKQSGFPLSSEQIAVQFREFNEYPVAVAVSGGVDSMSLMLLLREHLASVRINGSVPLLAVTVDHQLRAESLQEAKTVAAICGQKSIAHVIASKNWNDILECGGKRPPSSRLQELARTYRYSALRQVCHDYGVQYLFFGHTLNDQNETLLLRLARGSGVSGLAGMQPLTQWYSDSGRLRDVHIVRPFLTIHKTQLQHTCTHRFHQVWIEDPSNVSDAFDRVRIRKAIAALESQRGIDILSPLQALQQLATEATAAFRELENDLLEKYVEHWSADCVRIQMSYKQDARLFKEIQYRIMTRILCFVGKKSHPPRLSALKYIVNQLDNVLPCGKQVTLHGCRVMKTVQGKVMSIVPEHPT